MAEVRCAPATANLDHEAVVQRCISMPDNRLTKFQYSPIGTFFMRLQRMTGFSPKVFRYLSQSQWRRWG